MYTPKPQTEIPNPLPEDVRALEEDLDMALRERYAQIRNQEQTANPAESLTRLRESADFWESEIDECEAAALK